MGGEVEAREQMSDSAGVCHQLTARTPPNAVRVLGLQGMGMENQQNDGGECAQARHRRCRTDLTEHWAAAQHKLYALLQTP